MNGFSYNPRHSRPRPGTDGIHRTSASRVSHHPSFGLRRPALCFPAVTARATIPGAKCLQRCTNNFR